MKNGPLRFGGGQRAGREQRDVALERTDRLLQDAHDGVARAIDGHGSTEHRRIAREAPRPIGGGQHRHAIAARVVRHVEESADEGLLPDQGKVRAGHGLCRHPLRRAAVGNRDAARLIGRDGAERGMVGLERAIVDDREPEPIGWIVRVNPEQILGRVIGQRIDEHRAYDANHPGRGAKTNAHREDDRGRQRGRASKAARAVEDVSPEVRQVGHSAAARRAHALHEEVKRIPQVLSPQPARRRAVAVLPAAKLEQFGQVVFDRPPVVVAEEKSHQPAHVTPCVC